MTIVLVLLGIVIGAAAADDFSGALLGGAVGWLLARSLLQQREIDALKRRIEGGVVLPAEVPGVVPAAVPTIAPAVAPAVAPAAAPSAATDDAPASVLPAAPAPTPPPATTGPRAPGLVEQALGRVREWFFGGNTIVKVGITILFIGLAFLAKYASEHIALPVELRLAAIAAVALVLLVLGWRLRTRRAAYAQALQGGAVAVLYLTLFAANRFYGVVGAGPAFALMAGVAALAAALAVLQNARALASIGALGGYATPLLLSTGGGNHVALFGYYFVLGGGVLAVAGWRLWRELNLIAFFFTFGVGSAWGVMHYRSEHYASAQSFLVLFFVLFLAMLLLPARRAPAVDGSGGERGEAAAGRWINGSLLFGLPTVVFGLQYGLVRHWPTGPALAALLMAAVYIGLATLLRRQPRLALAFEGCLAVGTVLLTLVIPLALDQRSTAGAWALEGAGLVWLGLRQQRRLPRVLGYGLIVVAGMLLLHTLNYAPSPTTWLNASLLATLMLVAGALGAARVVALFAPPTEQLRRADGGHTDNTPPPISERIAEPLLVCWALFGLVLGASVQIGALVPQPLRLSALITTAALAAAGLGTLAVRLNWRGAAWPLIGLAPLLLLAALAGIDWQPQPFAQGGWWAWPLALVVLGLALRHVAPFWAPLPAHLTHVFSALVVATLGAAAGRGWMAEAAGGVAGLGSGSAWPWLGWLAVPALLLLALPRPVLASRWPFSTAPDAYLRDAAAVLCAATLGWALLANLVSPGGAAPLPYVPLLNPLDLGAALALFAAAHWLLAPQGQRVLGVLGGAEGASGSARSTALAAAALGVSVFVWLNAMLVRAFHHLGGVPFRVDEWAASLAVQTGLTLLWSSTALALMWWSARAARRAPWMTGAALLAVVVLKLLLVDLSASGTVTRIVSFIGAGVLMLVIGWVAPLPARQGVEGAPDART